jgi:hypothetical protein
MLNKFKAYFETLEGLTTEALTHSAEKLVRAEKRNVALLIAHIAEISRRKVDLECGYKSVFEYCVKRLNLSEGSVALRLQAANVSRRFPQLLVALAENRLSLTVAGKIAPHLSEDNVEKLLSDCAGMSKREVEEYLVGFQPKPVFHPSIRKRPSSERESHQARLEGQPETTPQEKVQPQQPGSVPSAERSPSRPPQPLSSSPNLLEPAMPDLYNFRFSADGNFKAKFERLAEVLGVENALKNMAEVIEKAIDISLEKKDPKRKLERRLEKKRKRKPRPDEVSSDGKAKSRYIPSEIRERVHARAGYRCEWRGLDGTRCSSRTGLEIDHQRPYAIYRSNEERYLRLLCARHNLFEAERVYGTDFIRAKVDEKRRQKSTPIGAVGISEPAANIG